MNVQSEYYSDLHGNPDHLEEYHAKEEAFDELLAIYRRDPGLFKLGVDKVYFQNEATPYPRYPAQTREPEFVAGVPEVPEEERESFRSEYLNRTESCPEYGSAQEIQYPRWDWAVDNLDVLVNQLRLSGISDGRIANMFLGTPLWAVDEGIFDDFRRDLSHFALKIEEETGWTNVGIAFTGSSVNGFSQNPCKGRPDIPT